MKDYASEYKGYCLTCKNYDLSSKNDATTRGFRCTYHGRPMAMDEKCPRYSRDIAKSNSYISSAVSWMNNHGYDPRRDKDTFCYITTICCDILGYSDSHIYLESLRALRDYLLNSDFGKKILFDYDVYGVKVAQKVYESYTFDKENTLSMINEIIVPNYFEPLCALIQSGQFEQATNLYVKMTFVLMRRYHINYYLIPIKGSQIESKDLGHGYDYGRKLAVKY